MRCVINQCLQDLNDSSNVSSHRFPKKANERKKWIRSILVLTGQRIDACSAAKNRICGNHFADDDYKNNGNKQILRKNAVPTMFTKTAKEETQNLEFLCSDDESTESMNASLMRKGKGNADEELFISPDEASRAYPRLYKAHERMRKSKINLMRKFRRLRQRVITLEQALVEAQNKNMISQCAADHLKVYCENNSLLDELQSSKGGEYSEELRCFAVTLSYYSPRAYQFVRQSFGNRLPHPKTISKWYRSIDGEPGITSESMAALKILAEEQKAKGERTLVCLMMDEISIRRQIEWNHRTKKFEGSVQYSGYLAEGSDDLPMAKDAIVFMVSGVKQKFKIPVGYFFTDSLDTEQKTSLIERILTSLHDIGITVIAFTFDGLNTNISTAKSLGASLKFDDNFKTNFNHPCTNEPVYIIMDVCHMLKLFRNTLSAKEVFKNGSKMIKWNYIAKLNELQNLSGMKIGKLTNKHINFHNEKMRVDLAAQTLSRSVAGALRKLKSCKKEFHDCEETINCVELINDLFDIFNSKHQNAHGFKRPMNSENIKEYRLRFQTAFEYISELQVRQEKKGQKVWTNIINTVNKTGFIGFLVAIQSFDDMFARHVEKLNELDEISCYRFSQDHLETFFAAIRAKGGNNNNPTTVQFKAAYKRMILNNDVTSSAFANCMNFDEVKMLHAEEKTRFYIDSMKSALTTTFDDGENIDNHKFDVTDKTLASAVVDDEFATCSLKYAAIHVQKQLVTKLKCEQCLTELLQTTEQISVNKDILLICKIAETELKILTNQNNNLNVGKYYSRLENRIVMSIYNSQQHVFSNLSAHILNHDALNNHRNILIKLCIDFYLKLRLEQYAKNIGGFKDSVRKKLTKVILFRGD